MSNYSLHSRLRAGGPKPERKILVRGARQLLTLHHRSGSRRGPQPAELGLIVDGSVLIRNGLIENVGPTRSIENLASARNAEEIDASGRVVLPAFIDAHTCIVPVPGCRNQTGRPVESFTATRLEAQAEALLKIMARHGTATIGALTGHGGGMAGELKILRTHQSLDRRPLDIESIVHTGGLDANILQLGEGQTGDEERELLQTVARRKLAATAAFRGGGAGEDPVRLALRMSCARALGLAVRLDMAGERDSELLETAVNAQAVSVSAASGYSEPEIELLAGSSVVVILLPQMLARTGLGGSARELVDGGALVALGSGIGPGHESTASMQTVIQLACELCGLSLEEAITAATVNAAWALGIGSRTGALEHGKAADLILLNASDYREIPVLSGTNLTYSMIKRGVLLFKDDLCGWPSRAGN